MSTITLQNFRVGSDLTVKVRLKDGGVAIDWSTLSGIRAVLYSDAQSSIAGRCDVTVDGEDPTLLVCRYAATKMQYLGVNRIVVSAKYMGVTKTYDKPAFTFVRWSEDQAGEEITIEDPEVTVEIDVEDVSSSILQEAVDAAFSAADRANEAAEAAEHMVDIHTGPEGKSAYEVAVEEGYTGTEEEWLASLKGPVGETPDISIGTVTTVEPGTPAAASMGGTPEAPVLNLSIPKGLVGATPNITVGTVTTGQPGTPVVVTITGTPEAPVLNVTIPQGMQGNTGSSVDYPYELVNNLTTDDATKGLSAAQGVVLDGKVSQLEAKVTGFAWTEGKYLNSSGNEVADAAWGITDFIPYTQGNAVTWKWGAAVAVSSGRTINFYKADKTYISGGYWSAAGSTGVKTIQAASIASDAGQAVYIRASFKLNEDASVTIGNETAWVQGGGLAEDVEKNTADIATLYEDLATEVTDPFAPTATSGTYWDDEGVQSSSSNWESYQIDLSPYVGKTITFKVHGQVGAVAYSFIKDSSNATIWSESVGDVNYEHSFLVEPAMKTLLVSNRKANGSASFFVTYDVIAAPDKKRNDLSGKKVSIIGDSITYGFYASDNAHRYSTLFCAKYNAVENNLGVAATCIANNVLNGTSGQRFVTRATQANLQDSKLIIVFGGTNDFSYDSKAIGDLFKEETITADTYIGTKQKVAVTDTATFAGALHDLITTIRTNCPNVPIVFLTPLKRGRYTAGRPTSYESNQWGDYLDDFCNAIKQICAYYSIPVLDLNAKSELDFSNASIATMFSDDSLHPNDAGHAVLAEILYRFIEDNVVV